MLTRFWQRNKHTLVIVLGLVLVSPAAMADTISLITRQTVTAVQTDGSLTTTSGTDIALHGISLLSEAPGFRQQAQLWLATRVIGADIRVFGSDPTQDRHGRWIGQLYTPDHTWLQGALLEAGLAFATPEAAQPAMAEALLQQEQIARAAGMGFWGTDQAPTATPYTARDHMGHYRLVTGKIVSATQVKAIVYLNFGPNYRTDFTVKISGRLRQMLEAQGHAPADWDDKWVTVRGVIFAENGPMIAPRLPTEISFDMRGIF